MIDLQQLDSLDAPQMREALLSLMREVAFTLIDKLTHENAVLKRLKFAATSEKFRAGLSDEQKSLIEETLDTDIAEVASNAFRRIRPAGSMSCCRIAWRPSNRRCQWQRLLRPPSLPDRHLRH